jgi:hypothetical protein
VLYGLQHAQPFKIRPSECQTIKNYSFLRVRFDKKTSKFVNEDDQFKQKGFIRLRGSNKLDGSYRSVFGPSAIRESVIFAVHPVNVSKAMTRTTGAREGDHELDSKYRFNQQQFIKSRRVKRFSKALEKHIALTLSSNLFDFDEELIRYAIAPHKKRKLRVKALAEIMNNNLFCDETFIRKVQLKMKPDEFAKVSKYPRMIGDLSVVGSLLGGFSAKIMKKSYETFNYSSCHPARFIPSPSPNSLKDVFKNLISPEEKSFFNYFSDDSNISIKCKDGVFRANLDISSCDTSHTPDIFSLLINSIPDGKLKDYIRRSVEQLKLGCTYKTKTSKVKFGGHQPTLYSGSVLTTLINNLANLLIQLSITSCDFSKILVKDAGKIVLNLAGRAGYIISIDDCSTVLEDLQFLKFSPTADGTPYQNLGVMLRSLGSCKGDLPGKSKISYEVKADRFNSALVCSWKYSGCTSFYKMLAVKFKQNSKLEQRHQHYQTENYNVAAQKEIKNNPIIDDSCILRRYQLTQHQYDEMISLYLESKHGAIINCIGVQHILAKDYGYPISKGVTLSSVVGTDRSLLYNNNNSN